MLGAARRPLPDYQKSDAAPTKVQRAGGKVQRPPGAAATCLRGGQAGNSVPSMAFATRSI
eukprot:4033457-Pleurochrysis_carterae.AAC.2